MSITTYLAIALISLEVDALHTLHADIPFKFWRALAYAALWPISCPLVIVAVVSLKTKKKEAGASHEPNAKAQARP